MVRLRPHHFMCVLGFAGKGYSREFVANMRSVCDRLKGESSRIEGVEGMDDICAHCPHWQGTRCEHEEKIQRLDAEHRKVLDIQAGETLTWTDARARLLERMTEEARSRACACCYWNSFGYCAEALRGLRAGRPARGRIVATATLLAVLLTCLNAPLPALAAKKAAKKTAVSQSEPTTVPADEMHELLFRLHKSVKARSLKKAFEALKKNKFATARSLATPLQTDELFGDFGLYLTASAYRAEAGAALPKKPSEAAATARKAIPLYLRISTDFPFSPFVKKAGEEMAAADLIIGDSQALRKKWKEAEGAYERGFQRLVTQGGFNSLKPETLERYSEACAKTDGLQCPAWLQKFVLTFPRSSEEFKAIVAHHPALADLERPSRVGGKTLQPYKAPDMDQAAFDAAMNQYLDGKYSQAIKGFRQFLDEFPRSPHKYRARYWLAQGLSQQQEHDQATKAYEDLLKEAPLTYYGLLAAIATGKNIETAASTPDPVLSLTAPFLQPHELIRLKRIERFIAEGADELATLDLKEFHPREYVSNGFLMYLAALNDEAGNHGGAFTVLSELIRREYPGVYSPFGLKLIFPSPRYELVQKYATQLKLDPILVMGLMKQESAFDAGAVSGAGAMGLMQIMPATAVDTDAEVHRADLTDADVNIRVGTKYIKKLLTRFNGNIAFALAGYNAGPNAVDRWVREGRAKRGLLEFVESIPYKETREYVGSIIRNYLWYSKRITGENPKTLSYFWNLYGPPVLPAELPPAEQPEQPGPIGPQQAPLNAPVVPAANDA